MPQVRQQRLVKLDHGLRFVPAAGFKRLDKIRRQDLPARLHVGDEAIRIQIAQLFGLHLAEFEERVEVVAYLGTFVLLFLQLLATHGEAVLELLLLLLLLPSKAWAMPGPPAAAPPTAVSTSPTSTRLVAAPPCRRAVAPVAWTMASSLGSKGPRHLANGQAEPGREHHQRHPSSVTGPWCTLG